MIEYEAWNQPTVDPNEQIMCPYCGRLLAMSDAASIVLTKGTGATMADAPVHEMVCRRCAGIPDDLGRLP